MKTFTKIITASISMVAAFALTAQGQNLLSDPNFASGTGVAGGFGGWTPFNGANFSTNYTYGGGSFYSMENSGPGGYSVPGAYQYVAATAGTTYLLTGYAYIPTALASASDQGFLQITFVNSAFANLGTVQTSPGNALVSTPIMNNSSPTGTWVELSALATAPVGTAYAEPFTLVLDADAPTTVYFADLSLTAVPEPSTLALAGMGLAMGLFVMRRRLASQKAV
jgi:hypothetical protein